MITPVTITTPDGVERVLRFTLGAKRRIARHFGRPAEEVLKGLTDGELPAVVHCCMFDENGQAPGIKLEWLEEHYDPGAAPELLATLTEALSQGAIKKNEALEKLSELAEAMQRANGTPSGALPDSGSASPALPPLPEPSPENSGTSLRESTTN